MPGRRVSRWTWLLAASLAADVACSQPARFDSPGRATSTPSPAASQSPAVMPTAPAVAAQVGATGPADPVPPTAAHPYARYVVTGARSGVRATVLVRLPPAYFDPAGRTRVFPVIETFHGSPGHVEQWLGKLRLGSVLDREVTAHRIAPAIVVSPDMNYPSDADRECIDADPGGPALETWASQDVPDWVEHTFRARTDRDGWATIGLSTGGWCAAMSTMLHPDRFRAAMLMSGYFRPQFPSAAPYPATGAKARRYDLVALARSAAPPVAIWLETSPQDALSYATSRALSSHGRFNVTPVILAGNDHAWNVWSRLLPSALDWLARSATGFAP